MWRIAGLSGIPRGLTVTSADRLATIAGTPQSPGTYTLAVMVETDPARTFPDGRKIERVLTVQPPAPSMRIGPLMALSFTAGRPLQAEFQATGGVPPVRLAPGTATAPEGLAWSCAEERPLCTLSGTPRAPGRHALALVATDAQGTQIEANPVLTVTMPDAPGAPQILPDTLPVAIAGEPYTAVIVILGLDPGLDLKPQISGPAWLDASTKGPVVTISGTPPAPARTTLTISDPQFAALIGRPAQSWTLRTVAALADDPCAELDLPEPAELPDIRSREAARVVQQALATAGFYTSTIDGIWGAGSQQALSNFRTKTGLPHTDGIDACTFHYLTQN